jgi:hypothetical protein
VQKRIFILSLALVLSACAWGTKPDAPGAYRTSKDGKRSIFYISPGLALTLDKLEGDTLYCLVNAQWLNRPDYINSTGDSVQPAILGKVDEVGACFDIGIIYGSGRRSDAPLGSPKIWFLCTPKTEGIQLFTEEKSLIEALKTDCAYSPKPREIFWSEMPLQVSRLKNLTKAFMPQYTHKGRF